MIISPTTWDEAIDAPKANVVKGPVYPFEAWRSRTAGYARVVFRTDSVGHVTEIRCVDASDDRFRAATEAALAQWKFAHTSGGPFRLNFRYSVSDSGAFIEWN